MFFIMKWLKRRFANPKSAVISIFMLVFIAVAGNTAGYMYFDGAELEDSMWYSIISITTIGYGDYSSKSTGARLTTILTIVLIGLPAFGLFIGVVGDAVMNKFDKIRRGLAEIMDSKHIIIVNYPGSTRVRKIVEELQADPSYLGEEIVILADVDALPFSIDHVKLSRGVAIEKSSYIKANIIEAAKVIVLSPDYDDANSDALVAGAVHTICDINNNIKIIAECIDEQHKGMFGKNKMVTLIMTEQIARNSIVQESYDPGVGRFLSVIASNLEGTTLFSTEVDIRIGCLFFSDLVTKMMCRGINVFGVISGDEVHTGPVDNADFPVKSGDRVIYAHRHRLEWHQIAKLLNEERSEYPKIAARC